MIDLKVVICTRAKTDHEFEKRPIFNSLQKQILANSHLKYKIFKDNKNGLSFNYNQELLNPDNKNSILLFVHDDVVLEDIFLYEKLTESPYSITGLAGTKIFNKQSPNLAWHLASSKTDYVGEVAHANQSNGVWTTCFGPTKSRALILDGLFLSCKVNDLLEKNLTFDENFGFHFYDISFCLRANDKKLTCGTLPIRVVHHGLGDSMLSKEWSDANILFKKTYCQ